MNGQPTIALAGNPNTGKSSLFNRLTRGNARVGNYTGVTVESQRGTLTLSGDTHFELIDLPGSYSLVSRSAEEQIAIDSLLGLSDGQAPALVLCCVDATNMARNLYLVMQLQELGLNVMVALTMVDELAEPPDVEQLSTLLECPVCPVVPRTGQGLASLQEAMQAQIQAEPSPRWQWEPSADLQRGMQAVRAQFPESWPSNDGLALWALMSIGPECELARIPEAVRSAVQIHAPDESSGRAIDDEAIQARFAWIDARLEPCADSAPPRAHTRRADSVLIHPVWGFAVFLLLMATMFRALFAWADPMIGAVEDAFGWLGEGAAAVLGEGLFGEFVVNGLIGGVGSVLVFLPQILLLFFFVGLMEDSGYMARVAYLMDRIMKSMGLHGRAFVPMLSGFACAVPAVMATRTMERRRDRILTMMVVPLMTCSARLPVYTLVIATLFPAGVWAGWLPIRSSLMVALYLFSVLASLGVAWVLSRTVLPAPQTALVLELPPYRLPRLADVLRMMWSRSAVFLKEAGTVILVCTVLLWGLLTFPRPDLPPEAVQENQTGQATPVQDDASLQQGSALRNSYGGQLGRAIEPLIEPLGFDWKMGVGLIGAFAAREVFVATMGVVYNVGDEVDEESSSLRDRIRASRKPDGSPSYSPLVGLSLLVFFALACQCMSTVAAVKRETHGYRWPLFMLGYMTALAWICSFVVYQGGLWLGFS